MSTIIQQVTGDVCEPCYALNSGIDPSYWEDTPDTLSHCKGAALDWLELGHLVLSLDEEPVEHFGTSCIVCGTPPYAGSVYECTLTVFA